VFAAFYCYCQILFDLTTVVIYTQCLQRYVEQTVFGDGRSVLKCMNTTGDVCEGHFSDEMIGRSLSAQVFAKYSEAQTRDALKAAKIDNLMACYNCTLQVPLKFVVDLLYVVMVFISSF
jgi:hypothetical protein